MRGRQFSLLAVEPIFNFLEVSTNERLTVIFFVERIVSKQSIRWWQSDLSQERCDQIRKLVASAGVPVAVPPHCPKAVGRKQFSHSRQGTLRLHPVKRRCAGNQIELTVDRRVRKWRRDHGEPGIGQPALGECDQRRVRLDGDKLAWIALQQGLRHEAATSSDLKD